MTSDLNIEDNDKLNMASDVIKTRILSGEIPPQLRNDILSAYRSMIKTGASHMSLCAHRQPQRTFPRHRSQGSSPPSST